MSRREVETSSYIQFARRVIRAAGERVGDADDFELGELITLRDDVENAIAAAVKGQRTQGRSWQYIADGLGIKRQSAFQRYADRLRA